MLLSCTFSIVLHMCARKLSCVVNLKLSTIKCTWKFLTADTLFSLRMSKINDRVVN